MDISIAPPEIERQRGPGFRVDLIEGAVEGLELDRFRSP
jgi:hypothetical protein